jgi:hypothetical protein
MKEGRVDWSDTIVGALGIIGTIAGTVLGYHGALRGVQMQLDHEDRNRFQDQRLDAYLKLATAIAEFRAVMLTIKSVDETDYSRSQWTKSLGTFNLTFQTAVLCAGRDAGHHLALVHTLMAAATRLKLASNQIPEELDKEITQAVAHMVRAMRTELGIARDGNRSAAQMQELQQTVERMEREYGAKGK